MDKQEEFEFALRFMTDHPKSAIKVLEKSDMQAVSSLLSSAPVNYITPVLRLMLPEFAARVCDSLEPDRSAAILSTLDANSASIILRLLNEPMRNRIQEEMPSAFRTKTKLLLDYSQGTVGAWMSPHMLVAASDMQSKGVLKLVRNSSSQDDSEYIYVTDRDGVYLGRVRFIDILKAGEKMPVTSYMDSTCPSLTVNLLLEQAQAHRAWEYSDVLPVTDADNHLLGLFHHHLLRQAVQHKQAIRKKQVPGEDALSGIFEVYGQSLLALLNTLSESVDTKQP